MLAESHRRRPGTVRTRRRHVDHSSQPAGRPATRGLGGDVRQQAPSVPGEARLHDHSGRSGRPGPEAHQAAAGPRRAVHGGPAEHAPHTARAPPGSGGRRPLRAQPGRPGHRRRLVRRVLPPRRCGRTGDRRRPGARRRRRGLHGSGPLVHARDRRPRARTGNSADTHQRVAHHDGRTTLRQLHDAAHRSTRRPGHRHQCRPRSAAPRTRRRQPPHPHTPRWAGPGSPARYRLPGGDLHFGRGHRARHGHRRRGRRAGPDAGGRTGASGDPGQAAPSTTDSMSRRWQT